MQNEVTIRLAAFAAVLITMTLLEAGFSRRRRRAPRLSRWGWNLGLVILDTLCLRSVAPLLLAGLAVGAAAVAEARGWGLFNLIPLPYGLGAIISFLILDFAIYVQHVAFHKVPALWRLHQVHHSDIDVDVTTALRFHPVEILLSMGIKIGLVLALGAPAIAVLLFEIVLNGAAMFNHANFRIAPGIDRWLRWVLVTPDMHRVHHSSWQQETDSNYGFNFPWWDRLCGTYRDQPRDGHEGMRLGLEAYPDPKKLHLGALLLLPFRRPSGSKPPPPG